MAISFVGATNGVTSLTIPGHAVGDLIVMSAFNMTQNGVQVTLPGTFTLVGKSAAGALDTWMLAYKIATSTSDVSGNWGSNSCLCCAVYRGIDPDTPIGAWILNSGNTSAGIKYADVGGLNLNIHGSTSWVGASAGAEDTTGPLASPPSLMVLRFHQNVTQETASFDTNGPIASSYPYNTIAGAGNAGYRTLVYEIRATPRQATIDITLGNDTPTAEGFVQNNAVVSATLDDDIVTSDTDFGNFSNSSITLGNDTLITSAVHLSASINFTLGNDTITSLALQGNEASVNASLANDTTTSLALQANQAVASFTLGDDTITASADLGGYGSVTVTLGSDTITASGISGREADVAITLGNDTLTANAELARYGSVATTLDNDTVIGLSDLGGYGTATVTLDNDTLTGFAVLEKFANLTVTLGNDTVIASNALHGLEASIAISLGNDTLDAYMIPSRSADVSVTLDNDTLAGSGVSAGIADVAITLGDDTLDGAMKGEAIGLIVITLGNDTVTSSTELARYGSIVASLDGDTLSASMEGEAFALINIILGSDIVSDSHGGIYTEATVDIVLGDDFTISRNPVTESCCRPGLCDLSLDRLVCNYVNALPDGPVWDRAKGLAIDYFRNGANSENSRYTSVANHAVYVAHKLKDIVDNGLNPALRESSPFTAYDTLDDWLDRYSWVDCFNGSCRDMDLGPLTPFEFQTECGTIFCEVETPDPLKVAVKHALVVALSRLDMGILATLESINWVIEPLDAKLIHVGSGENCPIEFNLNPISRQLPAWSRLTCDSVPSGTVQAWFDPTTCNTAGLPSQIWPALMSAECIVRSVLQRNTGTIINRKC